MFKFFIFFTIFLTIFNSATSQELLMEGKEYASSHGKPIYMPLGKISFADKVVSFNLGNPHSQEDFSNPAEALGEPNYTQYKIPHYVSLGCGGQLTLEFTDNGFINMDGPDIYVWEVGPSEEDFLLEISKDGKKWRSLGRIDGGKSYIDIAPVIQEEQEVFYFVRLTDLKQICTGDTPGADIDAVGTISGVIRIELNADVLFDSARFNLKPEANLVLENLTSKIAEVGIAEILIEGHTDSDGSVSYNQELSQQRAGAVLNKLQEFLKEGEYLYKTKAHGKTKPIANNETEKGKQLNRRVEIIVLPHKDFYKKKSEK